MQRSGYATDPAYADKLARVIQTVARHAGAQRPVAAQLPAAIVDNHSTSV
jgi:flagellum-specific peptidoglycan hydrolase FlgJ